MFASGGSDGSIMFWLVGTDKDIGAMEQAHDGMVWSMAWHPLGHILCSGSNDHSSKFWTRNRPGDRLRDKYNLNLPEEEEDFDSNHVPGFTSSGIIPGMDTVYTNSEINLPATSGSDNTNFKYEGKASSIPGLTSPTASSRQSLPGLGSPTMKKPTGGIPGLGESPGRTNEKKPFYRGSNLRPDAPSFRPHQPPPPFNNKPPQEIPGLDHAPKDLPGPGPNQRFPFHPNPGPRPGMIRPPVPPPEPHAEKKPLLPDPSLIAGFPPFSQGNINPPGSGKGGRPSDQRNALLPDPPGLPNKFPDGKIPGMDRPPEGRDFHMGQGPPGPPVPHQGPNLEQRSPRPNDGFENRDPRQHRPGQEQWMRDNDREGPGPPDFDRSRRGLLDIPPEFAGRPPPDFRPPFSQAGPGPDNRPPPNQIGPGPTFRPPHPDFPPGHPDNKEPDHRRHPDINAPVFRQGGPGRGRGREGPWEDRDHDENERDHPPHPFQNHMPPRGFRNQGPGSSPGAPEDPRAPGRHPERGPHADRRSSFEEPGLLGPGPGGPANAPGGPRPLMSLDIIPPPVDQSKARHILDYESGDERAQGARGRERDRPEGERGPNPEWDRSNRDRPGTGPPRTGPGPWTDSDEPRNERRDQPGGDPRMRRGDGPWGDSRSRPDDQRRPEDVPSRPDDPRSRPDSARGRPDDPRGRPDVPRNDRPRPEDPRNRPEDPRNRPDESRSRPDDPRSRPDDPRSRSNDPRARPEGGRQEEHRGRVDEPRVRPSDPRARQDEMRNRLEDMHARPDDPRNMQRMRMEEQRGHPSPNWPHHNDKHPPMMDEHRRHPDDPRVRAMEEQRLKAEDPRNRKRPMEEPQFQDSEKRGMDFQPKIPRSEAEAWKGPPGGHQPTPLKEDWFSNWDEEKGSFGFSAGGNERDRPDPRGVHGDSGRGRGRGRGRS